MKRRGFLCFMGGVASLAAKPNLRSMFLGEGQEPGASEGIVGMYVHQHWPYNYPWTKPLRGICNPNFPRGGCGGAATAVRLDNPSFVSLFAKRWKRCLQHIPSRKGVFHDAPSSTHDRRRAGTQSFAAYPSLLPVTSRVQSHASQGLEHRRHHPRPQETSETAPRSQSGRGPALSQLRTAPQASHPADRLLRRRRCLDRASLQRQHDLRDAR